MRLEDYVDADLLEKFEFYSYNHALEIITQAFPEEWSNIVECLRKLDITVEDLRQAGGNETNIPKKFDDVLYPINVNIGDVDKDGSVTNVDVLILYRYIFDPELYPIP